MRKSKRILTLLLAMLMVVMAFGCGSKKTESEEKAPEEKQEVTEKDFWAEGITAKKIGSIDASSVGIGDGGIYYKDDNGKYGIMSFDGKSDTGAKYIHCESEKQYFVVTEKEAADANDAKGLNVVGLVDATGKEIVPLNYASVEVLNERYVKVSEVTEMTSSEDEALIYYTSKMFSFAPGEGDILFKGNWYVYDITTGKKVEGVAGTQAYNMSAYGNYIKYYTDSQESRCVNAKGESLPTGADLFQNGCYALAEGNEGVVYDENDKKLFSYKLDGFVPTESSDEYFIAVQRGESIKYVLMDREGEVVSAEFTEYPMVYGTLLLVENKVYNFDGENVIEGEYDYMYFDKFFKSCWLLKNTSKQVFIKEDGTVLYEVPNDDTVMTDSTNFLTRNEDSKKYYSLKDKDYTLEGYGVGPWLLNVTKPNNVHDVVDAVSGKAIIEGYASYSYADDNNSVAYIYARKANGGLDIYKVQ